MTTNYPFQPIGNTAKLLSAAATTSVNFITAWPQGGGSLRVANKSASNIAYINLGPSTVGVKTGTGMPILPGTVELFTVGQTQTYAAAIGVATATLHFTPGQGGV